MSRARCCQPGSSLRVAGAPRPDTRRRLARGGATPIRSASRALGTSRRADHAARMFAALLAVSLSASEATRSASTPLAGAPAVVVLEGLDGKVETRPAAGFQTNDPRALGAHVLVFSPAAEAAPADASAAQLELRTGERWIGALRGVSGEEVEIRFSPSAAARARIDEIRALTFPGRLPADWTGALAPAPEGDRLYRVRGRALDIVDGATEEFTAEGVRFHGTRIDSKLFPWSEIAALFVESLGGATAANPASAADVPVIVDLTAGSRVRGVLQSCAQEKIALRGLSGQTLEFPFALVRQLFVDDGAARYLSELAPSSAEASRPFGDDLGLTWPHRVDQSVTGRALTAGGRVFGHGFGVHAPSKLVWKLAGGWSKLRGRVAVDDEVLGLGERGSVVFRVLLDGKKVWESAVLHGGDAPVAFPAIELGTASELTLEVDPGADSFVADRADWLDVMLVK